MLTRLLGAEWGSGKLPRAFMYHKALCPQCVFSQSASKTPIVPREMYVPLSFHCCSLLHTLLAPAPLPPLFLCLPSPGGLGNSAVPPVPTTGMPWGCQGDLEQSPCNFSQRVRSHNMNGNDFLSTDGEGGRLGRRKGRKERRGYA